MLEESNVVFSEISVLSDVCTGVGEGDTNTDVKEDGNQLVIICLPYMGTAILFPFCLTTIG